MKDARRRSEESGPARIVHDHVRTDTPLLGAYIGAIEILGLSGADVLERDYLLSALLDMTPWVSAQSLHSAQSQLVHLARERFRSGFPARH